MRDIVDIRKKASVPAQVAVETYSVLTRLLPPRRTVPSERPGAEHGMPSACRLAGPGVNELERLLQRITRELDDHGAGSALVGGLAVSVRTEPRIIRDIDLAVSVSGDNQSEALVATRA